MRFAPKDERSIEEQLASLTEEEKKCVDNLKASWEAKNPTETFSDEMYLRFARCSPGKTKSQYSHNIGAGQYQFLSRRQRGFINRQQP